MAYTLSNRADEDIVDIYLRGTEMFGSQQAELYHTKLANSFDLLALNPRMGKNRPEFSRTIRLHPCGSHIILYRLELNQHITIIRIRHASEDWLNAQ